MSATSFPLRQPYPTLEEVQPEQALAVTLLIDGKDIDAIKRAIPVLCEARRGPEATQLTILMNKLKAALLSRNERIKQKRQSAPTRP